MNSINVFNNEQAEIPQVSLAELEEAPHAVFKRFRAHVPFLRRPDGVYLALRANDIVGFYNETKTRHVETDYIRMRGVTSGPVWDVFERSMLFSNGATHKQRRAPVARTFAFRMVAEFRSKIRMVADTILDQMDEQGEMDLLSDYSSIIPAQTIASIIGLPHADIPRFTALVYVFSKVLSGGWSDDEFPAIEAAATGLLDYVEEVVSDNRRSPSPGFMTDYLAAVEAAGEISQLEALMQLFTLVIGGSDTTRAAIVIQTSLLLQHKSQWHYLVDHPEAVPNAVLECLRYEPPIGSVARFAIDDLTVEGFTVPNGSVISLMTMSAMRDELTYADPDRFDIRRPPEKWLPAFGGGAHRCLGEALARIELEESLLALLQRHPHLDIVGDYPKISGHAGIRRIENMRVNWTVG